MGNRRNIPLKSLCAHSIETEYTLLKFNICNKFNEVLSTKDTSVRTMVLKELKLSVLLSCMHLQLYKVGLHKCTKEN